MSDTVSLDRLVGALLAERFAAAVAERDERDRARYAALTGRTLPTPRPIAVALGFARVAAVYRARYGVAGLSRPRCARAYGMMVCADEAGHNTLL